MIMLLYILAEVKKNLKRKICYTIYARILWKSSWMKITIRLKNMVLMIYTLELIVKFTICDTGDIARSTRYN
jgi:hypothetical protein